MLSYDKLLANYICRQKEVQLFFVYITLKLRSESYFVIAFKITKII